MVIGYNILNGKAPFKETIRVVNTATNYSLFFIIIKDESMTLYYVYSYFHYILKMVAYVAEFF